MSNPLKAFVQLNALGKVVPGTLTYTYEKPKTGRWKEVELRDTISTNKMKPFVNTYKGRPVAGSLVSTYKQPTPLGNKYKEVCQEELTCNTTTNSLFSGTLYWGEDSATACGESLPITATGDGTTFCNTSTFTGSGFSVIGTGGVFISAGGQLKTVNHVSGDPFVTFNGGCDPCLPPVYTYITQFDADGPNNACYNPSSTFDVYSADSVLIVGSVLFYNGDLTSPVIEGYYAIDGFIYHPVVDGVIETIEACSPLFSMKINVPDSAVVTLGLFYADTAFDATIDYGDGNIFYHTGSNTINLNNTYSAPGTYLVTVDITNPINNPIYYSDTIISKCSIDNLYNLDALNFQVISFQNQETIFNNPIDFSKFKGIGFEIQYNTYGNNTIILPATSNTIYALNFNYGHFSSSQINDILATVVNYNTVGQLDIQFQVPLTPPTGQGIIDKAILIANGWTVNTD